MEEIKIMTSEGRLTWIYLGIICGSMLFLAGILQTRRGDPMDGLNVVFLGPASFYLIST
jgi:hypothetical protein